MCVTSYDRGGATVEMAMNRRVHNTCVLAFRRHLRSLAIVPSLVVMLAFPVSAQTTSDSWIQRSGSGSARPQVVLKRSLTNPHLTTAKAGSYNVTPAAKTNAPAAKDESKAAGTPPDSNVGPKKVGSAILINIDKTNQKMTVFINGVETYD